MSLKRINNRMTGDGSVRETTTENEATTAEIINLMINIELRDQPDDRVPLCLSASLKATAK